MQIGLRIGRGGQVIGIHFETAFSSVRAWLMSLRLAAARWS